MKSNEIKETYKKLYLNQHVPFCFECKYNGYLLLMNNDFVTYSFWKDSSENFITNTFQAIKFTAERLLRSEEYKIKSWAPIENLFNYPEKYFTEKSQIIVNNRIKLSEMKILIPVSIGELYDKISILRIKLEKIDDKEKVNHIQNELNQLVEIAVKHPIDDDLFNKLLKVNKALWGIEDNIRIKEKRKQYDEIFIKFAQAVYITNDERSKIKKQINEKYESDIVEVKSYEKYND